MPGKQGKGTAPRGDGPRVFWEMGADCALGITVSMGGSLNSISQLMGTRLLCMARSGKGHVLFLEGGLSRHSSRPWGLREEQTGEAPPGRPHGQGPAHHR